MIEANEKRYEAFNSIRRTIDAALFLGIPEDKIRDVFKRRGPSRNNRATYDMHTNYFEHRDFE